MLRTNRQEENGNIREHLIRTTFMCKRIVTGALIFSRACRLLGLVSDIVAGSYSHSKRIIITLIYTFRMAINYQQHMNNFL